TEIYPLSLHDALPISNWNCEPTRGASLIAIETRASATNPARVACSTLSRNQSTSSRQASPGACTAIGITLLGRPSRVRACTGTKHPNGASAGTRNAICSTPLQQADPLARTSSAGLPPTNRSSAVSPRPVPQRATVPPGAASGLPFAAGSASGAVSLEKKQIGRAHV